MTKITFTGASGWVTGSRHLIETASARFLLDCGLYQGRRKDTYEKNLNFPFDPASIDSLILSHAHIDHIGNVPNLVKKGFKGDIHCTMATADLAKIMLLDSANIQENDAAYVNKVRARHREGPVEPLYTREDIPPVIELMNGHSYNRSFRLDGVKATFKNAGHIVGSALTIMNFQDNGRSLSLCYTGDLGRPDLPIIHDPYVVTDSDVLIIESTYGDRLHNNIANLEDRLARVLNETIARGGKILIPSFALERAQEIVYILHRLRLAKFTPDIPVYVDSPLASDVTEIFRMHPECFDQETNEILRKTDDPFGFKNLRYTRMTEESKALNEINKPMIIIAGSGMAESGRILHHLKKNIEDERNTILIVGWQSENTLGWKIQQKWPEVRIFGETYKLKSRVEVFDEFSSHADRNDLINWVSKGIKRWRKIFIVHGESKASQSLAAALREIGIKDVIVPELGSSYEI
ncbi:MAG TPA: MBL fold metallo-hydrolase [Dehalococcoidales bacterium]|nr:MBL fold metallo-hydrolase [Dehalococcoidales bacterium]